MTPKTTIQRLARATNPRNEGKLRSRIMNRIKCKLFADCTRNINISSAAALRNGVLRRISQERARAQLAHIRDYLSPGSEVMLQLRNEILHRIRKWNKNPPLAWHAPNLTDILRPKALKIVSVAVISVILVQLIPFLSVSTPISAKSQNLLVATRGFVAVTDGAEWGPVHDQMVLDGAITVRTGTDSEATIILRDNAVLRLSENTELNLRNAALEEPLRRSIARVIYGQVWITAMLPETLPQSIRMTIPQGVISIKQGSINLLADPQQSTIQAFYRYANVLPTGSPGSVHLIEGDQLVLLPDGKFQRHIITNSMRSEEWVKTNLSRDAVHRSDIAERRQELAKTLAGILPTSTFYVFKRASEAVDMLLTIGTNNRREKKVRNAQTRLNEAVALLEEGNKKAAESPLAEYRNAIKELASVTEEEARNLLTESLRNSAGIVASALPHNNLYIAKAAVTEATTELSTSEIRPSQVDMYLLSDALLGIESLIAEGQIREAENAFEGIAGAVSSVLQIQELNGTKIDKNELKVIKTVLRSIIASLEQAKETINPDDSETLSRFAMKLENHLPASQDATPSPRKTSGICMTVREVMRRTNQFLSSVYTYQTPRAQRNEVLRQIASLPDCAQSGRVLSKVMNKVPVFTRSFVWEAMQKIDTEG